MIRTVVNHITYHLNPAEVREILIAGIIGRVSSNSTLAAYPDGRNAKVEFGEDGSCTITSVYPEGVKER